MRYGSILLRLPLEIRRKIYNEAFGHRLIHFIYIHYDYREFKPRAIEDKRWFVLICKPDGPRSKRDERMEANLVDLFTGTSSS